MNRVIFRGIIFVLAVIVLIYIASYSMPRTSFSPALMSIEAPRGIIHALVATSTVDQEKGLGDRDSLPSDQGMIFIFSEQGMYNFWMKDMHFPLDIVWIDGSKKIVGLISNISPTTYPSTFLPPSPVSYVLELNAGSAEKYGIATGTTVIF